MTEILQNPSALPAQNRKHLLPGSGILEMIPHAAFHQQGHPCPVRRGKGSLRRAIGMEADAVQAPLSNDAHDPVPPCPVRLRIASQRILPAKVSAPEIKRFSVQKKTPVSGRCRSRMFLSIPLPFLPALQKHILGYQRHLPRHAVPGSSQSVRHSVGIRPVRVLHGIVQHYPDGMLSRLKPPQRNVVRPAEGTVLPPLLAVYPNLTAPSGQFHVKMPLPERIPFLPKAAFPESTLLWHHEFPFVHRLPQKMSGRLTQKGHLDPLLLPKPIFLPLIPEGVVEAADPRCPLRNGIPVALRLQYARQADRPLLRSLIRLQPNLPFP